MWGVNNLQSYKCAYEYVYVCIIILQPYKKTHKYANVGVNKIHSYVRAYDYAGAGVNNIYSFLNNGYANCYLVMESNHEIMYRKGFITVSHRKLMKTHVKRNGKLDWWELLIFMLLPLILCYRLVAAFIYCPFEFHPFIFWNILPHVNVMIQFQEHSILCNFVDGLIRHIFNDWSYLIIHHFESMVSNFGL